MSYKMRINFRLGEDLEKRVRDGRNEYSITVYVDRIILGTAYSDRTFWVNDGDHILKIIFNNFNVKDKYRTSVDLGKKSFMINGNDAEFTVIAEPPESGGIKVLDGKAESAVKPPAKSRKRIFSAIFRKTKQ